MDGCTSWVRVKLLSAWFYSCRQVFPRLQVYPFRNPPSEPPEPSPDPDASHAQRHAGINEKKKEGGRGSESSISCSTAAFSRRSLIFSFSCFHLAAPAICHLARAQNQPSPAASHFTLLFLLHLRPRMHLFCLDLKAAAVVAEDTPAHHVHMYEE